MKITDFAKMCKNRNGELIKCSTGVAISRMGMLTSPSEVCKFDAYDIGEIDYDSSLAELFPRAWIPACVPGAKEMSLKAGYCEDQEFAKVPDIEEEKKEFLSGLSKRDRLRR